MFGVALDELEPELPPMFGQFAEPPPCGCGPGAGAGVELDEPGSVCDDDEPLLDELPSLWPHAAAAPPRRSPVNDAATIACLSRKVMSFTSSRDLSL